MTWVDWMMINAPWIDIFHGGITGCMVCAFFVRAAYQDGYRAGRMSMYRVVISAEDARLVGVRK